MPRGSVRSVVARIGPVLHHFPGMPAGAISTRSATRLRGVSSALELSGQVAGPYGPGPCLSRYGIELLHDTLHGLLEYASGMFRLSGEFHDQHAADL